MVGTMRWIEFTTNCNSQGHRFKIGDVVQLEYEDALVFIGGSHARWRLDLEREAPITKPQGGLDTALKNIVEKDESLIPPAIEPFGCDDGGGVVIDSIAEQNIPAPVVESEVVEIGETEVTVKRLRGRPKRKGIRDEWMSMPEALKALGLKDTTGNRVLLKTAMHEGKLRGETREGERPVYQFDKTSVKAFKRELAKLKRGKK